MVAVVVEDLAWPAHPEGRTWLVGWLTRKGDMVFADSLSDIVGVLIPGYDELDDEHEDDLHLQARIDYLAPIAKQAQALILADLASQGVRLSDEELNAALRDKEQPAGIERWNPADPLVLLTTAYDPFTDTPRPEGSVRWLDPTNEAAFLQSLVKVAEGELWLAGRP